VQTIVGVTLMKIGFQFGLDFHKDLHRVPFGTKVTANQRIVLTPKNSGRILLIVEKKQ
jgi:hypothetical protein